MQTAIARLAHEKQELAVGKQHAEGKVEDYQRKLEEILIKCE